MTNPKMLGILKALTLSNNQLVVQSVFEEYLEPTLKFEAMKLDCAITPPCNKVNVNKSFYFTLNIYYYFHTSQTESYNQTVIQVII